MADRVVAPLLVIAGETASGKTELAIRIAKAFNGEIICCDSWTVRRGMDIGTAKPSIDERISIRHHMLDVVDPDEDFTAAIFKRKADMLITDIFQAGKLPIMAGGTGLYIDSVIYDYSFLDPGNRNERDSLNRMDIENLHKKADDMGLDVSRIDKSNKRRIIRLIETNGAMPTKKSIRKNSVIIGLRPDRDQLLKRIEDRVDSQISDGLEQEVRKLSNLYGWQCEGMKGVGYAQWQDYFSEDKTLTETRNAIVKATLDLAKKQRTWFKRNNRIHWLDTPVIWQEVVDLVTTLLSE